MVLTFMKKSVKLKPLAPERVLETFYAAIYRNSLGKIHLPHSDVFYVREAVQNHYGKAFTLKHVEWAMREEGWTD